uniref:Uncharacterized protein n=1 Tax=Triticum urartu TaxID=4572 RepID=A0A8R7PZJ6_TRIUA
PRPNTAAPLPTPTTRSPRPLSPREPSPPPPPTPAIPAASGVCRRRQAYSHDRLRPLRLPLRADSSLASSTGHPRPSPKLGFRPLRRQRGSGGSGTSLHRDPPQPTLSYLPRIISLPDRARHRRRRFTRTGTAKGRPWTTPLQPYSDAISSSNSMQGGGRGGVLLPPRASSLSERPRVLIDRCMCGWQQINLLLNSWQASSVDDDDN